jgi:phosphatidate cytidylyltransferase
VEDRAAAGMTRLLSGVTLGLVALAAVWLAPRLVLLAAAEILLLLAVIEYAALARASGVEVPVGPAAVASMAACAAFVGPWSASGAPPPIDAVLLAALVALGGVTIAGWRGGPRALSSAAAALFPALYLGLPIGAMVAIREAQGREALLLLMLAVIVSDTAQFYTGRAFGRRLLAPSVSPKKTIEGAVGGFVFGGLLLIVVGAWWLPEMAWPWRAALGAALVAVGIVGDLFESMLKRSAGVKDSSALIPGHGGVLDRIDALLFAAPLYYIVLKYA